MMSLASVVRILTMSIAPLVVMSAMLAEELAVCVSSRIAKRDEHVLCLVADDMQDFVLLSMSRVEE